MNSVRFFVVALCLGLLACASNEPKAPKTSDGMFTLIQADGTKQFSYTLRVEMAPRSERSGEAKGRRGGGRQDGPPAGGGRSKESGGKAPNDMALEQLTLLAQEGLLIKLEQSGYCRTGYRQLDTQSRRGAMNIIGECNELATEADRVAFPNPPPKQVIEQRLD